MFLGRTLLLLALLLGLSACGEDDPAPDLDDGGSAADPATATTSDEPDGSDEADVADLEELYDAYWEARIRSHNGPSVDADLYDGIATTAFAEAELGYVQSELIAHEARRDGRPVVTALSVTVDGDRATIDSCVDESGWLLVAAGEEVPLDLGTEPQVVTAARTDDGWRIDDRLPTKRSELTC